MTKRIHFVTFEAGGGHRTVVEAITAAIAQQYPSWTVRSLNLSRVIFDPIDPFYRLTGLQGEHFFYNTLIIAKGWLWMYPLTMFLARLRIWGLSPWARKRLQQYWAEQQPDLVVSTLPLYNRLLWQSLKSVQPETPFATLLCDLADDPPHHYIEALDQSVICPSVAAVNQAKTIGIPPQKILQTSGLPLLSKFYALNPIDIAQERQRWGLKPNCLTGLVFFGSQGSNTMLSIARKLESFHEELQLIFLCGHNHKVAARLQAAPHSLTQHVEGFTREVPYFMRLADFFIGKPGSNSVSEAIAMHLPVILEGHHRTVSHERANLSWVLQHQLGLVVDSFQDIDQAVAEMLKPTVFETLRANTQALENRAAFEIPSLLQQMLESAAPAVQLAS